ncbi:MAG TPA: SAM-dependent methyltransferase [Acidimicrobiales bacterium]|nr:SAM-dependent methyltransferase [Acidimicrobiales bacterium]
MARRAFRPLRRRLADEHPELDADHAIAEGRVRVDGRYVTNPNAQIPADAAVIVEPPADLRGVAKLGYALDRCAIPVEGSVALDIGAAAGGFTTALLERGAARVYALDAGYGQLLGSLRQDPRVVNLEATNVAAADAVVIPEDIHVVTVDVSYLPLRHAVEQLADVRFAPRAHLVGLVKPMFELALAALPADAADHEAAAALAAEGIARAGWTVLDTFPSAVTGRHGAVEWFVHAGLP